MDRSQHSQVGRITLFGQDVPVVVVLAILTLPLIGMLLGGAVGDTDALVSVETVAEFGALALLIAVARGLG